MLLHCAIVEDAVVDARKLACSLQTATEGKHELSVSFFESGDALLKSHSPADYDVAFLDICMPGTNGIETARQLRELSPSLPLIFITSSGDHVWQALSIHPFDYLLKPYSEATGIAFCIWRYEAVSYGAGEQGSAKNVERAFFDRGMAAILPEVVQQQVGHLCANLPHDRTAHIAVVPPRAAGTVAAQAGSEHVRVLYRRSVH